MGRHLTCLIATLPQPGAPSQPVGVGKFFPYVNMLSAFLSFFDYRGVTCSALRWLLTC